MRNNQLQGSYIPDDLISKNLSEKYNYPVIDYFAQKWTIVSHLVYHCFGLNVPSNIFLIIRSLDQYFAKFVPLKKYRSLYDRYLFLSISHGSIPMDLDRLWFWKDSIQDRIGQRASAQSLMPGIRCKLRTEYRSFFSVSSLYDFQDMLLCNIIGRNQEPFIDDEKIDLLISF